MKSPSGLFRVFALALFAAAGIAAEQLYTCGMHPQIIKPAPGDCPICGMKLTPVRANSPAAGGGATTLQIDPVTIQRMNLKTDIVGRGPVRREFRTVGTVAYDESGLRDITLKYEGWVEKLFVDTTWTKVKAGDPLFEIYSPDLYNAQLNYLVARNSEGGTDGPLTRAALGRLQLFDVAPAVLAGIARQGEASRTYVYPAPVDGVVIEKMVVAGQMMKPGEKFYRLADLSRVWVLAQVYEQDLPFVRAGQPALVRATYGPERDFAGEVALLLPQVEEQTRTATARIILPNPDGALRPGMFVDVRFAAQLNDSAILVPEMAVLRSGERDTVFVALEGGNFEPREVRLGSRSHDGRYEVLGGLAAGERIVTSGQFMLDSESQLREAIQKMIRSAATPAAPAPANAVAPAAPTTATPVDADALKGLAFASADAAAALAADDLAAYQKLLPGLRDALQALLATDPPATPGPFARFKDALPDPADLKTARQAFEPFSTAVTDAARAQPVSHRAGLSAFECPMTPVLGKGRWLQREPGIKNPFFGARMLKCGDQLK